MPARAPLQKKTPFAIDPMPLKGQTTARAGLCAPSRVFRSLGLAGLSDTELLIRQRQRGYTGGQYVESLVLLHAAGGDCMEDMERLREDSGVTKMLGYAVPSARALGDFFDLFHDGEKISQARDEAQQQRRLAFLPEESTLLNGLGAVLRGSVRAIVGRVESPGQATIDLDATIIESEKRLAQWTYEGTRGYQPVVAVWAETDLVLADEFRDGNVPAMMEPVRCARAAFAALPGSVTEYAFRGDSACHESGLINWLRDEEREDGPKGHIAFAVSARMSADLLQATKRVPEKSWVTIGTEADGTLRQWAEVDFVPREKTEKKDIWPLRYIGLRLLKPQGRLFDDGHDRRHFAILTNRTEDGAWVIEWHRQKAGTIEHVHDEIKNGLGGGRMPSAKFGANAAWFRIACIAYNVISALRQALPVEALRTAKAKRLRFEIFNVTGRFVRDRRKISLRLAAPVAWIKDLLRLFESFSLLTQASG